VKTYAFRGGLHPSYHKETGTQPTVVAAVPATIVLPMSQHLGAPCHPTVAKGDRVERGQVVGDVDAMVSTPVHSPVSGEVTAIGKVLVASGARIDAVTIASDPEQDLETFVPLPEVPGGLAGTVRAAGVVGMGGAAFPSAVKLSPPKHFTIDTFILNGCECEPYLTCDHRMMIEQPQRVVRGVKYITAALGIESTFIGVEDNKPDAIDALRKSTAGDPIEVVALRTRYPQGAEKQLIYAITRRVVPGGALPGSVGAVVHNVGTAVAIADAVELHKPLMERIVTVAGHVAHPGNFRVLLGTPVSALIEAAGGFVGPIGRVVAGGPMTGVALGSLEVPVVKGMSGIVVLSPSDSAPLVEGDQPCIRCGRCIEACPMVLHPYAIASYADRRMWDGVERYNALDCIECGCCSYVCPTRRPLVQLIKTGKGALMAKGVKR
jgi:electron transport complex protein RnfC